MRSAEEKLRAARATFGASSCHMLRVHSGADGAGRGVPWADLIGTPLPGGGAGEPLERPAAPAEARPVAHCDLDGSPAGALACVDDIHVVIHAGTCNWFRDKVCRARRSPRQVISWMHGRGLRTARHSGALVISRVWARLSAALIWRRRGGSWRSSRSGRCCRTWRPACGR